MQNHYFLIQIGHAIFQLMTLVIPKIKSLRLSLKQLHKLIFYDFKKATLNEENWKYINQRFQVRLL
jgi:hypothetical protein